MSEGRGEKNRHRRIQMEKKRAREGEKPQNECEELFFHLCFLYVSIHLPIYSTFVSKQKIQSMICLYHRV